MALSPKTQSDNDERMSFGDHLEELRRCLIMALVGVLTGLVVMLVFARKMRPEAGGRDLKLLSLSGALGVGVFQCAAFLPGTSRSLATILGGVLVGLSIAAAVEFSFLLKSLCSLS